VYSLAISFDIYLAQRKTLFPIRSILQIHTQFTVLRRQQYAHFEIPGANPDPGISRIPSGGWFFQVAFPHREMETPICAPCRESPQLRTEINAI
jgi:hypothetical protein